MNRDNSWYDIKKTDYGFKVFYKLRNRLTALFSLALIGGITVGYLVVIGEEVSPLALVLVALASVFLLIMGCLVDCYDFFTERSAVIHKWGFIVSFFSKVISFNAVETVVIRQVAIKKKKKPRSTVELLVKDGKRISFGTLPDTKDLPSLFESVGRCSLS